VVRRIGLSLPTDVEVSTSWAVFVGFVAKSFPSAGTAAIVGSAVFLTIKTSSLVSSVPPASSSLSSQLLVQFVIVEGRSEVRGRSERMLRRDYSCVTGAATGVGATGARAMASA
jgi:hypothetical protein